jgi:hypothetical protein
MDRMKFILLIIAVLAAVALLSSRISFTPSSDHTTSTTSHHLPTTIAIHIPDVKRVVTNVAHKLKVTRSSGSCSDDSDASGDDGNGACGDSGSDDQAGDNVGGNEP